MLRCVSYTDSMKEKWDNLALSRGTVFHTTSFRQILLGSFGYKCAYQAIINENNGVVGLIPLVIGRNLKFKKAGVSLPFVNYLDICAVDGDVLNFAFCALPGLREKYRLDYLELRLKDQLPAETARVSSAENYTFVLPLSPEETDVLSLSTSGNRNHVRKAYKNDMFAVFFDAAYTAGGKRGAEALQRLEPFYKVYISRMKELGSPAPDIKFFKSFFEYLPENSFLLTVIDKKTRYIIGGMLLLTSPSNSTLYYPYGASLPEYNNKYVNNFMYWEAIKFGIRNKMKFLDFGRSQANSGTYRYKAQWGAVPERLKYTVYDDRYNPSGAPDRKKLSPLTELWQKAPGFITDRVGSKLIKYVMP